MQAIVLDANILVRAVLGTRARQLILENASTVQFFAPDVAYADARKYLPALLEKRGVESLMAMRVLDGLEPIVQCMDLDQYASFKQPAMQRIARRDARRSRADPAPGSPSVCAEERSGMRIRAGVV